MQYEKLKILNRLIPSNLMEKAVSLKDIGIDQVAWKQQDAISVVEILAENRVLILGGDVYSYVEGRVKLTSDRDNWYMTITVNVQDGTLLQKSKDISIEYIKSYALQNGENYCYSIVF